MRILVHDFSGHPFQAHLARELAGEGHEVLHVHCGSYSTGKGGFGGGNSAGAVRYETITIRGGFSRYSLPRRFVQELSYGLQFVQTARRFRADVIISCNDPLFAKTVFGLWATVRRQPWIFWLQDLYSIAMSRELEQRGPLGRIGARAVRAIERRLLRHADAVVPITDDFHDVLESWAVPAARRTVIENWAPLAELPLRPRVNPWREGQGIGDRFAFLYSGTLGLKHNPDLLYHLADAVSPAEVIVISEGLGAARLDQLQAVRRLDNLRVLPYQPYESYADVLGAADVLLVLLEESAGTFSVPSKVLSYLCAGRPILAAIPSNNLAARTILKAGAGIVVCPTSTDAFLSAAVLLQNDDMFRSELGLRARRYAEATFDPQVIVQRFIAILRHVTESHSEREGQRA